MGNKQALFVMVSLDLKHTEANFLPNAIDSLCLRVAQAWPTNMSALSWEMEA
jgi:hypothetical protein